MVKISVVVPVYNKDLYLRECLNSLVRQTLEDLEIICVDDKSTDDSFNILMEYAAKDLRVKVYPLTENRGVSVARNIGIEKAKGEFVAFVDADDFVAPDFFEKLYSASAGYDCVKGEIWDYDAEIGKCALNELYDLNDKIKKTGNPVYFYYGFFSAIYRRSFINRYECRFPEGISYYEDPFFNFTVTARLQAVKVVDGARYFYRKVAQSLSHDITPTKMEDFYRSVLSIFSNLNDLGLSHENRSVVANQIIAMINSFAADDRLNGERLQHLKREYYSFLGKNSEKAEIKVSVIVPVYNGEKYLRRMLDCLTFQTLYAIEIICVNDHSEDNSLSIIKKYQKDDNRIKIVDCAVNGGESKARNLGIHAAKGEYIAFMDQDDRIDLFFYERLYEKAIETSADIIKGDATEILYNGERMIRSYSLVEKNPLYFTGDWWTAIYKRSLIVNNLIKLPEGCPLGGDIKFLFDACRVCNKVSVVHGVYYYHIMHEDSGDALVTSVSKIRSVIEVFSYILREIENSNLYEQDLDCYVFYYNSYINHSCLRIKRCRDLDGKLLCSDFIFSSYNQCRCKSKLNEKIKLFDSVLADVLENDKKSFFDSLLEKDILSEVFYEYQKENKNASVPCCVIVPFVNEKAVQKYILGNAFLKEEEDIRYFLLDNRTENKPISMRYNRFLDEYDYTQDSWFIFMHSDFEFLSFPSELLSRLDSGKIYGPVGAKVFIDKGKMFVAIKGEVFEKDANNTLYYNLNYKYYDLCADTLDCMCLIVHSSLVEKHHLRFDENTLFDLYVEDFCISAKKRYGVLTEVCCFNCAHHSSYTSEKYYSKRYLKQLEYINKKYPDEIYGGTVTPIGGRILPSMSEREFALFRIRRELLTGKKL